MTKKADSLRQFLASEDLGSEEGRRHLEAARGALASLPKSLSSTLVGKTWARFLQDAPFDLWRVAHRVHSEHLEAALRALKRHPGTDCRLQILFLVTACADRADDEQHEAFVHAATFLHFVAVKRAWVPRNRAEVEKLRPFVNDGSLLATLQRTFRESPGMLDRTSHLFYWHGVALLLLEGSEASLEAVKHVEQTLEAEDPAEARLVHRMRRLT